MKIVTEHLESDLIKATSGATVDHRTAAAFYIPQIPTASLPAAASVPGMLAYDTTTKKLVLSNGTAWQTVTSA